MTVVKAVNESSYHSRHETRLQHPIEQQSTATMSVRDVCTELLPDLDEDIFEYIVGALEEFQSDADADPEETATMVSSFLESAGYVEDEDEALAKAKQLIEKIGGGGDAAASDEPQKLSDDVKKMTLSLQDTATSTSEPTVATNKNTLIEDHQTIKTSKKNKAKKSNTHSAFEQAEQQALELEEELRAARISAVQARTKMGSYKGALDAPCFTLPNPGGGQPLLEDAACRMVWGRRYGLIGR